MSHTDPASIFRMGVLTLPQAADFLCCSLAQMNKLLKSGVIGYVDPRTDQAPGRKKRYKKILIPKAALVDYLMRFYHPTDAEQRTEAHILRVQNAKAEVWKASRQEHDLG